ncbi:hypothetical protein [Sinomonas susongensis]|uniref:hypothetical protein n=1 Tax=Sinomonas susongensis TaxID=1324851 RepID=UPI001109DD14|nr:hypothetical protein [Sinomonas susongensis]
MTTPATPQPHKLMRRSREALASLGVQFLLGMGANLVGTPQDNSGGGQIVAASLLGLHILVGVAVVVVAVRLWMVARDEEIGERIALWALVVLVVTFLIGIGTMLTGSGWLSFLMALGWLVGFGLYIQTFMLGSRAATGPSRTVS